ncbi:MAG: vancomycin resistance protein VanJ [Chloroflexota bacterium]|nr:vancomycin resistance protein VanJ [Chloroflexota bacterium]
MRAWIALAGSGYAFVVLLLSAVHVLAPQRSGILALSEVGAPFLFLLLLPLVPVALGYIAPRKRSWRRLLRVSLVACLAVAAVRFGPVWLSVPASAAGSPRISVTSWNVESGEAAPSAVVAVLRAAPEGIVALVELSKSQADAIRADDQLIRRFPYAELFPRDGSLGMGLLSSYPIVDSGRIADDPPLIWAHLDLGGGQTLGVVAAHPLPATMRPPLDYDASERDAQILAVRSIVDGMLGGPNPLVLAGDFNVTDREPGYGDLSRGLIDAHLEAGFGPGSTWRPDPIKWLPFGVLRIDMVFGGNGARPIAVAVDCTPRGSDHCLVQAELRLE